MNQTNSKALSKPFSNVSGASIHDQNKSENAKKFENTTLSPYSDANDKNLKSEEIEEGTNVDENGSIKSQNNQQSGENQADFLQKAMSITETSSDQQDGNHNDAVKNSIRHNSAKVQIYNWKVMKLN